MAALQTTQTTQPMLPAHRCARAEIDLDAFRHNVAVAARHAGAREVWPVIKGDAYGHGMLMLARAVPEVPCLCVVDLDEALLLRSGGIRQPILVLHGVHDREAARAAAAAGLTLVVHHAGQVELLESLDAAERGRLPGIWLKLDTGMHRLGVAPSAAAPLRARLAALVGPARVGTLTHFACADEPGHPLTERQLEALAASLPGIGPVSACNSAALMAGLEPGDDVVRPGIMLYGGSPLPGRTAAELDLRPVMTLRSRIIAVREIAPGETVGYGATWRAERTTRLGVVAAGYADGVPRHTRSGTLVHVAGRDVPIVGRVSMDSIVVDLTDHPGAGYGSDAVIWGDGAPIDRIAGAADTIALEVMARVPPRVPRMYRGGA